MSFGRIMIKKSNFENAEWRANKQKNEVFLKHLMSFRTYSNHKNMDKVLLQSSRKELCHGPTLSTTQEVIKSYGNYQVFHAWDLPMTVFFSLPKAQTQWGSPGTWKREKLHFELKYFGRKWAEARLKGGMNSGYVTVINKLLHSFTSFSSMQT